MHKRTTRIFGIIAILFGISVFSTAIAPHVVMAAQDHDMHDSCENNCIPMTPSECAMHCLTTGAEMQPNVIVVPHAQTVCAQAADSHEYFFEATNRGMEPSDKPPLSTIDLLLCTQRRE